MKCHTDVRRLLCWPWVLVHPVVRFLHPEGSVVGASHHPPSYGSRETACLPREHLPIKEEVSFLCVTSGDGVCVKPGVSWVGTPRALRVWGEVTFSDEPEEAAGVRLSRERDTQASFQILALGQCRPEVFSSQTPTDEGQTTLSLEAQAGA